MRPLCHSITCRCRDARSERPLYQRLQRQGFNGDGRTDRASLQSAVTPAKSRRERADTQVRPYKGLLVSIVMTSELAAVDLR